ncbi:MAG: cupredoxin domain-containing protein, partial [Acidimicrobiia bacterium]
LKPFAHGKLTCKSVNCKAGNGILAGLIALLLAACAPADTGGAFEGPPPSDPIPEGSVLVQAISYRPQELTVAPGREVVWIFEDGGVSHTVTAEDGSFTSGRLTTGEFRRTFERPGIIAYRCEVHAAMRGILTVAG